MKKRNLVHRAGIKSGQASTLMNVYSFSLLDPQVKREWHAYQQTKIKDLNQFKSLYFCDSTDVGVTSTLHK